MKIFFLTHEVTPLAAVNSTVLDNTRKALLAHYDIEEVTDPELADALIIREEVNFKNFRYIKTLQSDPIISKHLAKVFTINFDDCATGLLKGLYSNIPKSRLDPRHHLAVPYAEYFNELVFNTNSSPVKKPKYLASWRGNLRSNKIRPTLLKYFRSMSDCLVEFSESWLNHPIEEKSNYISLMLDAKFSLCPAGWAPSSFRIYESMALGRCPVIIADDFTPPKGPNWNDFALFFPQKKLKDLHHFLKEHESSADEMGSKAKEAWENHFSAAILPDYYADSLIKLIKTSGVGTNEAELQRWNSLKFRWSNKWTLPQRVTAKMEKLNIM
ncbi:MAG: exostosin family protein [Bacteroidota bacterium]